MVTFGCIGRLERSRGYRIQYRAWRDHMEQGVISLYFCHFCVITYNRGTSRPCSGDQADGSLKSRVSHIAAICIISMVLVA